MTDSITVSAPSSTANLGPGFDVFGLALDAFFDEVTLTRTAKGGVRMGATGGTPAEPLSNTAGIVVKNMSNEFETEGGIRISVKKGVPAGFGMGSSAASAAAAAVAFDRLFDLKLSAKELVRFGGTGEAASAGSIHYDNVAASILGGFVIVRSDPLDVVQIDPPMDLRLCVAIPKLKVPAKKTEVSRGAIPRRVRLKDSVENLSNAARIVAGFMRKDPVMIGGSIRDVIIEPAREHMIPGFAGVKSRALLEGALGVTISGAGPSVIAFADELCHTARISRAMKYGFRSAGTECRVVVCGPSGGASVKRRRGAR